MIRLSCIGLFVTEPKLRLFWCKKFTFCSSLLSLRKSWFQLLVAFTPADRFFKRLYEQHTKRANKRCRAYTSLFPNITKNFFKWCMMCRRKITVFMCKISVYFSAPPFSARAPSLRLLRRRHWLGFDFQKCCSKFSVVKIDYLTACQNMNITSPAIDRSR